MPSAKQHETKQPTIKGPIIQEPPGRGLDRTTDNPPASPAPDTNALPDQPVLNSKQSFLDQSLSNRLLVLMAHTSRYAFRGQARLAADAGVSRSTISRLLRGRIRNPSYALVCAVTRALETHLDRRLDPRELIAPGGAYPTPSGCALAGCRGCMPDEAYDEDDGLKPEYRTLRPGDWSLARPAQEQQTQSQAYEKQEINPQQTNTGKESR